MEWISSGALYEEYVEWADKQGVHKPRLKATVGKILSQKGVEKRKSCGATVWRMVRVAADAKPMEQAKPVSDKLPGFGDADDEF